MYSIVWGTSALTSFEEILEYLTKQNSYAAKIVKEEVLSGLELIKVNPFIFESDKLKDPLDKNLRAFVAYSFRITYRVIQNKKEVRIIRIRHTSREPLGY